MITADDVKRKGEKLIRQKRNREIRLLRLGEGFRQLIKKPWKWIPILLLIALSSVSWQFRKAIFPFKIENELLAAVYTFSITVAIPIIFLLLLVGTIILLGTPIHAKHIENSLILSCLVDRYGQPPVLIATQKVKGTDIQSITFFSWGVPKEQWEKRENSVLDALGFHCIEPIKYGGKNGNNQKFIVLTVAPGAQQKAKEEPLYDDEL